MKRRGFLAAAGAGLTVSFLPGCTLPVIPKWPAPDAQAAQAWVRHAGGRYTLFLPRVEMGQGILTALAQIAADELDVGLHQVRIVTANTDSNPNEGMTSGSRSVEESGEARPEQAAAGAAGGVDEDPRQMVTRREAQALGLGASPRTEGARQRSAHGSAVRGNRESGEERGKACLNGREHGARWKGSRGESFRGRGEGP
jgi:CO/xanthine dehydrogenase Mo-binding subunit